MALRAPFADLLDADFDDPALAALRRNELIGRPLVDGAFQDAISRRLGRAITPGKPGPKPKRERDGRRCGGGGAISRHRNALDGVRGCRRVSVRRIR